METTIRSCGAGYKVMTATMLVNDNPLMKSSEPGYCVFVQ